MIPVPWISRQGHPTGSRALVVAGAMFGVLALPYGFWTYLLGLAIVRAMVHQAIIDKRAAQRQHESRERWRDIN